MVKILKKGASKKSFQTIMESISTVSKSKGVEVYKYVGKIRLKEDALSIQKQLRDEWQ
jgi:hypothetical protein